MNLQEWKAAKEKSKEPDNTYWSEQRPFYARRLCTWPLYKQSKASNDLTTTSTLTHIKDTIKLLIQFAPRFSTSHAKPPASSPGQLENKKSWLWPCRQSSGLGLGLKEIWRWLWSWWLGFHSLVMNALSAMSLRFLYNIFSERLKLSVWTFLRVKAATALAHLSHCNSVCLFICPSVRLSHRWISQKWCELGSPNLHCRLPRRL